MSNIYFSLKSRIDRDASIMVIFLFLMIILKIAFCFFFILFFSIFNILPVYYIYYSSLFLICLCIGFLHNISIKKMSFDYSLFQFIIPFL